MRYLQAQPEFQKSFQDHPNIHNRGRPYQCSKCNKSFPAKSNLIRHEKVTHSAAPNKFKCSTCFRAFSRKPNLTTHQLVHMENRKRFHCQLCDKTASSRGNLQKHVEMVHLKTKKYQCVFCYNLGPVQATQNTFELTPRSVPISAKGVRTYVP